MKRIFLACVLVFLPAAVTAAAADSEVKVRIAVIGGALSGSLTTKYLAEFDRTCQISSVTVFEAIPIQEPVVVTRGNRSAASEENQQGTRVQTVRLSGNGAVDGSTEPPLLVEVGASIGFKEFHLILEHVRGDPENLKLAPPFVTGIEGQDATGTGATARILPLYPGLGIYNGRRRPRSAASVAEREEVDDHDWSLNTARLFSSPWIPSFAAGFLSKLTIVWRYGWELRRVTSLTQRVLREFARVPSFLNDASAVLESPAALWKAIGLDSIVATPFDRLLDALGVPEQLAPWRGAWLGHGSLRQEFLSAINLVNYNQGNHQINGLVGIGSFAAAFGGIFGIEGGNVKLIASAYRQANRTRRQACQLQEDDGDDTKNHPSLVRLIPKRVTTVIARTGAEGIHQTTFELFSNEASLGEFDIVVVAAPLQQARINFYVQSSFDSSVLQPMPLGHKSIIDPDRGSSEKTDDVSPTASSSSSSTSSQSSQHPEGHSQFPPNLDPASTRPYTQVVTTLVSNATLALLPPGRRPRSIIMTARGKAALYNITAITQLHHSRLLHHLQDENRGAPYDGTKSNREDVGNDAGADGVSLYKIFSDHRLSRAALADLFGPYHVLEHIKEWPRPYGGATPDYQAGSTSEHFLLYDGGVGTLLSRDREGVAGGGGGGAIYYPIAMEQSTLACMELSAIGAKATAKLIAHRLGLLTIGNNDPDKSSDEL